jgi:hypothetical protein
MAATAAQTMWPMLPREQSNFQPIKDFSRMTAQKNWMEFYVLPGMIVHRIMKRYGGAFMIFGFF